MLHYRISACSGSALHFKKLSNFIKSENNVLACKVPIAALFSTTSNFFSSEKPSLANMNKKIDFTETVIKKGTDLATWRKGMENFPREFKKWREELGENMIWNDKALRTSDPRGVVDMAFTFENEDDLKKFVVSTDSSNNAGYSSASLKITQNGTGLFSGNIVTTPPKDGNVRFTGFANMMCHRKMKSFFRPGYYNWKYYTHLVLKVRGDGRTYGIVIPTPGDYDQQKELGYSHPLCTRGGPYWQITRIPFSHFFIIKKARVLDRQAPLSLHQVAKVGISLNDGYDGPFSLEIDYIGLEIDLFHKNTSPYEHYYIGR